MPDSPYGLVSTYYDNYKDELGGEDLDSFTRRIHESDDVELVENMAKFMYEDKYLDVDRQEYEDWVGLTEWRDSRNPSFLASVMKWAEGVVDSDDVDTEKGVLTESWDAFKHSFGPQNVDLLGNSMEALGRQTGNEWLIEKGIGLQDRSKEMDEEGWGEPGSVQRIEDVHDIGDFTRFALSGIGQGAASMIPMLVAGGTAAVAAPALGAGAVATTIAAGGAALIPGYVLNSGETQSQIRDELIEKGMSRDQAADEAAPIATFLAVPLSMIDMAGAAVVTKPLRAKFMQPINKKIAEYAPGRVTQGIATGMAVEGGTEFVQSLIREGAAAIKTDDPDLSRRIMNAVNEGLIGAFTGGAVNAASQAAGKVVNRRTGQETPPAGEPETEIPPPVEPEAEPVVEPTPGVEPEAEPVAEEDGTTEPPAPPVEPAGEPEIAPPEVTPAPVRPAGADVDSRQLEIEVEQGKRRRIEPSNLDVGDRVLVDDLKSKPILGEVVKVTDAKDGGKSIRILDNQGNPVAIIDTGNLNAVQPRLYTVEAGRTPAEEDAVPDPETVEYRGELARVRRRLKENPQETTSIDALRKLRGSKEFTKLTEAERDEIDTELAGYAAAEEAAKAPSKPKPAPEPTPEPVVEPVAEPTPEPEPVADPEPTPEPAPAPAAQAGRVPLSQKEKTKYKKMATRVINREIKAQGGNPEEDGAMVSLDDLPKSIQDLVWDNWKNAIDVLSEYNDGDDSAPPGYWDLWMLETIIDVSEKPAPQRGQPKGAPAPATNPPPEEATAVEPEPTPEPAQPEEEATPASEEPAPSLKPLNASVLPGSEAKAVTPDGETTIDTVLAVVEADELVVSHDDSFAVNPAFPAELQPRDRGRKAGRRQVSKMAATLNYDLLNQSPTTDVGAPIVSPEDSVVESGNGRVLAIRRAYRQNPESAAAYRGRVEEAASAAGLDASAFENPVIVRLRRTDVDRKGFARASNERATARMSAVEQAKDDAGLISDEMMLAYVDSDLGITSRDNIPFVRDFVKGIPPNERGSLYNNNDSPTPELHARIENALLWKAYQDERLLTQQAEIAKNASALAGQKRIMNALQGAAAGFARARASGLEEVGKVVADAAQLLHNYRKEGDAYGSLDAYLMQGSLSVVEDLKSDKLVVSVAKALEARRRSGAQMTKLLNTIAEYAEKEGSVRTNKTIDAFGGAPEVPVADLVAKAIKDNEGDIQAPARPGSQGSFPTGDMWQGTSSTEEAAAEATPVEVEEAASEPVASINDINVDELLGLVDEGVVNRDFEQRFQTFDQEHEAGIKAVEQGDLSVLSDRELVDFVYRLKEEFAREQQQGTSDSPRATWIRSAIRRVAGEITQRQKGPEVRRLEEAKLEVAKDGDSYFVTGRTFDHKDTLKQLGGYFDNERTAWRFDEDPTAKIAEALGPSEKPAQPSKARSEIGEDFEQGVESIAPEIDADAILSQETKDLLARGAKVGIPEQVLNWQAQDAALIVDAQQEQRGMFLLASQAGSGKTFVLGAAIRELQLRGTEDIVYITMNKALIAQNQQDLGDFLTKPIRWMTYADLRGKNGAENVNSVRGDTVLIWDEAHNIKNTSSVGGMNAARMMSEANFTIMASATAFENPSEAAYLSPTGIFGKGPKTVLGEARRRGRADARKSNQYSDFNVWAARHGSEVVNVGEPGIDIWETVWRGGTREALAAQRDLVSRKVYSYRPLQLPADSTETAFTRKTVDSQYVKWYYTVRDAYDWALALAGGDRFTVREVAAHKSGRLNRIMEAAKVDQAVEQVRQARADGRHVVIFTQTKAPSHVGKFRLNEKYRKMHGIRGKEADRTYTPAEVERMLEEYEMTYRGRQNRPPPPFSSGVALVAKAFGYYGVDYPLPSVPEALKEALGDDAVLYTGGQSDALNAKAKVDFLSGKKPIIIATMDKGGTGLSLHDTVGNAPRTLVGINLPWTATKMDQALGRVTRYGMKSSSVVDWLYADNIPYEAYVAERVQTRMETMGAVLRGEPPVISGLLMDEMRSPVTKSQRVDDLMSRAPARQVPPHLDPSIEKQIKEVVARLAPTVSVHVLPELYAPTSTGSTTAGTRVQGYYSTPRNRLGLLLNQKMAVIRVALDSNDPIVTVRHEVIHALKDLGLFTKKEWASLLKAAKDEGWIELYGIRRRYPKFFLPNGEPTEAALEEAIADAFGNWVPMEVFERRMGLAPSEGLRKWRAEQEAKGWNRRNKDAAQRIKDLKKRNMVDRIFRRIVAFFREIGRMLSRHGHSPPWNSVFEDIEAGRIGARGHYNKAAHLGMVQGHPEAVNRASRRAKEHARMSKFDPKDDSYYLVAVHGVNQSDLQRILDNGGVMASPSIALVPANVLHQWGGGINLVFNAGVVKPGKHPIFRGDGWTAIHPTTFQAVKSQRVRKQILKKLSSDFAKAPRKMQLAAGVSAVNWSKGRPDKRDPRRPWVVDDESFIDAHGRLTYDLYNDGSAIFSDVLAVIYLSQHPGNSAWVKREERADRSGMKFYEHDSQDAIDRALGHYAITSLKTQERFLTWAQGYMTDLVPEGQAEKLMHNSKWRRDFQTGEEIGGPRFIPATTENILKDLEGQRGERQSDPSFGLMLASKKHMYTSLEEIRADRGGIVDRGSLDEEAYQELEDEVDVLAHYVASDISTEQYRSNLTNKDKIHIPEVRAAVTYNDTPEAAWNELHERSGVHFDMEPLAEIFQKLAYANTLPVPFFEAKPHQEFTFADVSHAVVSRGVPKELVAQMEAAGLTVIMQDTTATMEERLANQLGPDEGANVKFSKFDPNEPVIEFENAETEERWREASKGVQTAQRFISNWARKRWNRLTRHREHMANTTHNADVLEKMMHLEQKSHVALENIKYLYGQVMGGLKQFEIDLLQRKFVLEDLKWTAEEGMAIPFNLRNTEQVLLELRKVDAALAEYPALQERVRIREEAVRKLRDEMVEVGVLTEESARNPAYFRHQVLEYAALQGYGVKGKKVRNPFWHRRKGSEKDINVNYFEVEAEWMLRAHRDIATQRFVNWLRDSKYNQRPSMVRQAKADNQTYLLAALRDEMMPFLESVPNANAIDLEAIRAARTPIELAKAFKALRDKSAEYTKVYANLPLLREFDDFRIRIARGLDEVKRALLQNNSESIDYIPHGLHAQWKNMVAGRGNQWINDDSEQAPIFALLSWLAQTDEQVLSAARTGATRVLAAVAHRRGWIQNKAIPDRYVNPISTAAMLKRYAGVDQVSWQPDSDGKSRAIHVFSAKTIPERIVDRMREEQLRTFNEIMKGHAPSVDPQLLDDMLSAVRDGRMLGGLKEEFVLDADLAETLDTFYDDGVSGQIDEVAVRITSAWKVFILFSPRRFAKYFLNNMSGDIDAIMGNPNGSGIASRIPMAAKELYGYMMQGAQPSQRLNEALERGVLHSSLTMQEIQEMRPGQIDPELHFRGGVGRKAVRAYFQAVKGFARYRENLVRYAAYLNYVDLFESGMSQMEIGYGATPPHMVVGITDNKDKAARMARDALGDYGNLSVTATWARNRLMPFLSWIYSNTVRYSNLFANAYRYGRDVSATKGIALGTWHALTLSLRIGMFYGVVQAANLLLHPDEEEELSVLDRLRMHLHLGKDSAGRHVLLRFQGALSDYLGWLGMESAGAVLAEVQAGRAELSDVLKTMAKAPINRLAGALNPLYKVPMELISGRQFFPDIFNARAIRDPWNHFFRTFALHREYDEINKMMGGSKPTRGYVDSLAEVLVYRRLPGEMAYDNIRSLAYDWQNKARGTAGSFGGGSTPRGEALRNLRTARRMGDEKAAAAAKKQLREYGMRFRDVRSSLRRAHPLGMLTRSERAEFLRTLSEREKAMLGRAAKWYSKTYGGGK